ncbi:hypothetical protein FB464_2735 [Subtercola boreus]|nr:hypothetical protein FB464_2735 [Subtercola boreus]
MIVHRVVTALRRASAPRNSTGGLSGPPCIFPGCERVGNQVLSVVRDGDRISSPVCGMHGEGVQSGTFRVPEPVWKRASDQASGVSRP